MLKGSDIANNRTEQTNRYLLVTQSFIGESTKKLQTTAPQTWQYLQEHSIFFENRKSKLYKNTSPFAIFGVGTYTFFPYKIAICGLYKKLSFVLVSCLENKPVVFDDTVYFLSFNSQSKAERVWQFLNSSQAQDFLSSLIFWDDKRPIKSSILNLITFGTN